MTREHAKKANVSDVKNQHRRSGGFVTHADQENQTLQNHEF